MADTAEDNAEARASSTRRLDRVAELMARMAAGDAAAMVTVLEEFAGPIRRTVVRRFGHYNVLPSVDDVEAAMVDAGLILFDNARAWRSDGGAMPWRWAEARIGTSVGDLIGQHASPLEDGFDPAAPPVASDPVADDDLDAVIVREAERDRRVALVKLAMDEVLSVRDRAVLLAFRDRKAGGDPSPAHTVAEMFGLSADNVRQIASRSVRKLTDLITTDDRFAELRDRAVFRS